MAEKQSQHRPRVLTGIRSNEVPTIGNYLGAMLPMAELTRKHKETHDFFMFVPDLHSFTTQINHDTLYDDTIRGLKMYVAAKAVDLKNDRTKIYRQSQVPAHSELTWILDCFAHMGELSRMTQFKDKAGLQEEAIADMQILDMLRERTRRFGDRILRTLVEHDLKKTMQDLKHESISVGLFNYPVLMAADILLYNAAYVPLGEDQRQHLELTRDVAQRLNERFSDVYPDGVFTTIPKDWNAQLKFANREQGVRIRSLRRPEKKMSKSDSDPAGVISLLDDPTKAAKKIMSATTDSKGVIRYDWVHQPGITNLLTMLALLERKNIHDVVNEWQGKRRYGDLKQATAKAVADFLTGFQKRYNDIDDAKIIMRLERDEAEARKIANEQLLRVQQAVGLRPRQ